MIFERRRLKVTFAGPVQELTGTMVCPVVGVTLKSEALKQLPDDPLA